MDENEIRLKCIEFAFKYAEYYARENSYTNTYKTEEGIVSIARRFENYVKKGD